ncbi:hypothetical protein ENUP19_0061G0093 [Entamoeba nuttalli]|uniref:Presenilin n=2 Tax=Entamoeba nuttalli TaxID=412467 RepID=K2GS73_ENTNP|nr:presenilin 1 peptidase, putative [Entamoeba nuttalli P19]EKE37853.1 presenilin 1 peptidase, putative [Entamoeba nuttalli P19]|eukprot:XP_008859825.1 presenilin 1 peptidase, putative [Entamoeba nuttalli P19]
MSDTTHYHRLKEEDDESLNKEIDTLSEQNEIHVISDEQQLSKNKVENKENKSDEEEVEMITFAEYSESVNAVITPVAITLLLTVIIVKLLERSNDLYSQATSYIFSEGIESSTTIPIWLIAIIVSVIFIIMIVIVTFVFVLLFYYRCMKLIVGWLLFSVILLLMLFGGSIMKSLLSVFNWPVDWISFAFLLFNFGVLGVISIFYISPMKLNQFYMIIISVFMASFFTNLPEWTTWTLLIGMACYDLVAVLCPKGPLRILVNLAQERKEPIPALVYSTAVWMGLASPDDSKNEILNVDSNPFTLSSTHGKGVKLGLGDFVFYSVLVGRCAMYDLTIVFSGSVAVLSGLFGTLILLVVFNKALPALPISIFFGTLIYCVSRWAIVPLVTTANLYGYVA